MTRLASSTTSTSRPLIRAVAANSSLMNPAPMTTTCLLDAMRRRKSSLSSRLRKGGQVGNPAGAGADDQTWSLLQGTATSPARGRAVDPGRGVVQPPLWPPGHLEGGEGFGRRPKHRLAFEPCHRLADAAMDAG